MDEVNKRKLKFTILNSYIFNIGNAFVDYGSIALIRKAYPNAEIQVTGAYPIIIFHRERNKKYHLFKAHYSNYFSLIDTIDTDYFVLSGMILSEGVVSRYENEITNLAKKGAKLLISGGGGNKYNKKEKDTFREFIKKINPFCYISRDDQSYDAYKDLFEFSYNGIDCAFFVNDYFKPASLSLKKYEVHTFDTVTSPVVTVNDTFIVRAHHTPYKANKKYLKESNVMISDRPEDYLNLYANAEATHSDRVHACVATLTYGNKCKLYSDTPRAQLFEKVGIEVSEITENIVSLDKKELTKVKKEQVNFLSQVLNQEI